VAVRTLVEGAEIAQPREQGIEAPPHLGRHRPSRTQDDAMHSAAPIANHEIALCALVVKRAEHLEERERLRHLFRVARGASNGRVFGISTGSAGQLLRGAVASPCPHGA